MNNHEINLKDWAVTTSGGRPLVEIANDLASSGFIVDQILGEIGVITGTASDEIVLTLMKIQGVSDISVVDQAIAFSDDENDETLLQV